MALVRAVGGQPGALSVKQAPGPGRHGWEREVCVDAGERPVGWLGRQRIGPMGRSEEKHRTDIPPLDRYPVGAPHPPEQEVRDRRP